MMPNAARNLTAALVMVAAMASFCVNDAFMKALSARVPIGELKPALTAAGQVGGAIFRVR